MLPLRATNVVIFPSKRSCLSPGRGMTSKSISLFLDGEASLSSAVAAPSLSDGADLSKLLEFEPVGAFCVLLLGKTQVQSPQTGKTQFFSNYKETELIRIPQSFSHSYFDAPIYNVPVHGILLGTHCGVS